MKHLQVLTWCRWTVQDQYAPEFYTIFTASVLRPTWEFPLPCAAMAIRKGNNKIFIRLSYQSLLAVFLIPSEYQERLATAYKEAVRMASYIQGRQKTLHKISELPPGAQVVRTDTGEVIAEAERIIRENQT